MKYGKILIVDDEEHIVELIKFNLENVDYQVITSYDGESAIDLVKKESPDLVILDLMLPGMNGIDVCREIKEDKETSNTAIIMLTARSSETDKITGLEIGADDYITKPFSIKELIARVKAVLRRSNDNSNIIENIINIGDICIDHNRHEVSKKGVKLDFTLKEFELLSLLARNKGKVLSRNFLLDEIWGYEYFGDTRTVDVHIRHIRKKIESDDQHLKYIETIRGIGYKMR